MSKRELSGSPFRDTPPHQSKRLRVDSPSPPAVDVAVRPEEPKGIPATVAESPVASGSQPAQKRLIPSRVKKGRRQPAPESGTHDHILADEVGRFLSTEASYAPALSEGWEVPDGLSLGQEVELVVKELSSTGDSLSLLPSPYPPWVVVTPFALPQERIIARVYRHGRLHSLADLVRVVEPNASLRDDSRVRCGYFGKCAGCQYQMLSYDTQLELKRTVVERAYAHFSDIPSALIPAILPTIASPKTYAYRTKITPHFDAPPSSSAGKQGRGKNRKGKPPNGNAHAADEEWELKIGFDEKGRRRVIDIEECPIATEVINVGLVAARKNVQDTIHTYKRGATLLLRDSLVLPAPPAPGDGPPAATSVDVIPDAGPSMDVEVDDGRLGTIDTTAPSLPAVEIEVEGTHNLPASSSPSNALASDHRVSPPDVASIADVAQSATTADIGSDAPVDDIAPRFPPPETQDEDDAAASSFDPSTAAAAADPLPPSAASNDAELISGAESERGTERHVCVTSPHATIHERVGPYLFSFLASAFFQNNNAVLVPLTDYVREAIVNVNTGLGDKPLTHFVDAYCGSGLFSIALSPLFERISGIDISVHSISSATNNLHLNALPASKFSFQTGTASAIFASVAHFPGDSTAVVIDPPRKGCDEPFLEQLVAFRPKVVVYVSCNVHTQARDVGWVLRRMGEEKRYRVKSIRGFDLFPQTSHVESVAVLVRD